MSRLRPALVAALLATALPAQTYLGEPPALVGQPTVEQDLTFAKLGYDAYEDIAIVEGASPTDTYVAVSGRLVRGGPFVVNSFRWNQTTGTVTRLTDYDGIRQDGDRNPTVSRDRLLTVVWRGASIVLARRAAPTDPWGTAVPISGLSTFAYSPALTQIDAGPGPITTALIVCTPPPTSTIEIYHLDPALAAATLYVRLAFPMQRSVDYWQFATPVEDPVTGSLVALFPVYRQGFPNRGSVIFFVAGIDSGSDGESTAIDFLGYVDNLFSGGAMRPGGRFAAIGLRNGPAPPAWSNNLVNIDTVFTTGVELRTSGGPLKLGVYSPPGQTGSNSIIGVGLPAPSSIEIPGVLQGSLGLAPNPPPVFMAQPTPANGVTQWSLFLPPTVAVELRLQAFLLQFTLFGGSTADLSIVP